MSTSSTESLTDPFTLIEKGIALERAKNLWGASDFFSRASISLSQKSKALKESATTDDNVEQHKIASLFHQESVEYFNKARKVLLEAMVFEEQEDVKRSSGLIDQESKISPKVTSLMSLLSDEESRRRIHIFHRLFASSFNFEEQLRSENTTGGKESEDNHETSTPVENLNGTRYTDEEIPEALNEEDTAKGEREILSLDERLQSLTVRNDHGSKELKEDVEERTIGSSGDKEVQDSTKSQETSLEERLAALESSLGEQQNLKSESRRLDEIHSGLSSLGVHIPQRTKNNSILEEEVISEEEQIDDILNYARDEVLMDKSPTHECDDVEEILKRAGIRVDMPSDDELITERYSNGDTVGDLKKDDLRIMVEKTQQLLVQVSLCLDEESALTLTPSSSQDNISDEDEIDEDELVSNSSDSTRKDQKQGVDKDVKTKEQKLREIGKDKLLEAKQYMELLTKSLTGPGSQKP